jgi:hypothetical protein
MRRQGHSSQMKLFSSDENRIIESAWAGMYAVPEFSVPVEVRIDYRQPLVEFLEQHGVAINPNCRGLKESRCTSAYIHRRCLVSLFRSKYHSENVVQFQARTRAAGWHPVMARPLIALSSRLPGGRTKGMSIVGLGSQFQDVNLDKYPRMTCKPDGTWELDMVFVYPTTVEFLYMAWHCLDGE